MRVVRRSTVALLAGIAILGTNLVAAAPAQAFPQGCTAQFKAARPAYTGGFAVSMCNGGSGSHRVKVSCARRETTDVIRYGRWSGTREWSYRECGAHEKPVAAWVEKQGD